MAYTLSKQAEEDIINIFVSGAELFGVKQASYYHQQLALSLQFLADNPMAAPVREEITPPVRMHPIGSHIIIYQIDSSDDVFIIRVRHAHEDWLNDT